MNCCKDREERSGLSASCSCMCLSIMRFKFSTAQGTSLSIVGEPCANTFPVELMAAWQCRYIIRLFIACQANRTLFAHELSTRDGMKGFTGLLLRGLSLLRNRFIKSQQHLVVLQVKHGKRPQHRHEQETRTVTICGSSFQALDVLGHT